MMALRIHHQEELIISSTAASPVTSTAASPAASSPASPSASTAASPRPPNRALQTHTLALPATTPLRRHSAPSIQQVRVWLDLVLVFDVFVGLWVCLEHLLERVHAHGHAHAAAV